MTAPLRVAIGAVSAPSHRRLQLILSPAGPGERHRGADAEQEPAHMGEDAVPPPSAAAESSPKFASTS